MLLLCQLVSIIQEPKNSRDWNLLNTVATGTSQILSQQVYLRLILVDFLFQLPLVLTCSLVGKGLSSTTHLFIVFHFAMMNCELTVMRAVGSFLYRGDCGLEMALGLEVWSGDFIGSAVDVDLSDCFVFHWIKFIGFRKRPKIKIICFLTYFLLFN